jgi:hypothetical protein
MITKRQLRGILSGYSSVLARWIRDRAQTKARLRAGLSKRLLLSWRQTLPRFFPPTSTCSRLTRLGVRRCPRSGSTSVSLWPLTLGFVALGFALLAIC